MIVIPTPSIENEGRWYQRDISFKKGGSAYSELVDVADGDHLRGVVQEAAHASQPHQILFVSEL